MPSFKQFVPVCVLLCLAAPSAAQIPGRITIESGAAAPQEGSIRIQSSLNFFLPGPNGDSSEAQKVRERGRAIIYDTAAHECELLLKNLAKDCRLETVNASVNGQRQFNPQQPEGYNINGTMALRITLK